MIYTAVGDSYEDSIDTITITTERIDQIAAQFKGVWDRMPTDSELDKLIEEEVRSEVYYRDAMALGLDKNDAIVRRRMRQKMEFLVDTGVYLQKPTTTELAAFFTANEQDYLSEPRLAFEQIYLGQSPQKDTASKTLKTLLSDPSRLPSTLGQRTFLPAQMKLSQPGAIDSVFGKGFYNQVVALIPGKWGGPVISTYGTHLVRTLDGKPGRLPSLDEIHEAVLKDWQSMKAEENRQQDYLKRRSRYIVEITRKEEVSR